MKHEHGQIKPEHLHHYDQNHTSASRQLDEFVRVHRLHTEDGCSISQATACLTGSMIAEFDDPIVLAIIMGVAVERLAAES